MGKKIYTAPQMGVEQIHLSKCLLDGSPVTPVDSTLPLPPHPGNPAPVRRTEIF